ncbi:hypothetical protein VI817_007097 [Penicillium citrinum]|nr:hypothetical protein VI817_007097 [Penicillium citrinum]
MQFAGLTLIPTTRPWPINERGLLCMGRASRRHTSPLTESNLKSTMAENEEIGLEERLKSALWLSIGKIVDEETIKLGVNATPQFIGALTEMVWAQIETVSQDLESFAKHAGRSTVNVSDVMLLARRNEGLESILKAFVEQQREEAS